MLQSEGCLNSKAVQIVDGRIFEKKDVRAMDGDEDDMDGETWDRFW